VINLEEAISSILEIYKLQAQAKRVDFVVGKDTCLPRYIEVDKLRMQQILNNLVHNAVKFTEQG